MLTATIRMLAHGAAPRPHHRVDRCTRRGLSANVRPHRHHGARVLSSSARCLAGTDAVVRTEAPYSASPGHRHQPWSDRRVRPPAGREGRRRAHGRGLGHGLRAADRQRRPRHPHQGGAPTQGYSMAADERLRGDVGTCCPARPRRPATRWPSTRPAPRSTTSRSAPRSRCCSRDRPRSSPWSAPSASAARRTSAAPRRRTSTRRPRSGSSAAPASSTRSG